MRRVLWCLYAVPITVLLVAAEASAIHDTGALGAIDLLVSLPSLVTLYLYIFDRRVLTALAWRSYAIGFIAWEVLYNLWLVPSITGAPFRAVYFIAAALLLPLYVALFRYAFQDWHAPTSP